MILQGRVPLRISFAGGGTDFDQFCDDFGGLSFNASISLYIHALLELRDDNEIHIISMDLNKRESYKNINLMHLDGNLKLVKSVIKYLGIKKGFNLTIKSDAQPGTGLGQSGCLSSLLVKLLSATENNRLDLIEVAKIALFIERKIVGIVGGKQDQFASIYGGLKSIKFIGNNVILSPINIDYEKIKTLERNLFLINTNLVRQSGNINQFLIDNYKVDKEKSIYGLTQMKLLTIEMINELTVGRLDRFGELIGEAWKLKKCLNPHVSNPHIDELYACALKYGATGGKLLGAGSGGYLLIYCPSQLRQNIKEKLVKLGASITTFQIENRGLEVWEVKADKKSLFIRQNQANLS